MQKPTLPQGTRDFGPEKMARRIYIFDTIRTVFKKFGFQPIETPSFENLSVLTGKYGEEGDQLIFKILNSRLHESSKKDLLRDEFEQTLSKARNSELLTERALRYDLTVPFARYVVMNRNELTFPFKRYQIQPVWRADKPQKGRYREFFQCDADVVGTKSLLCEAEIVWMIDEVLSNLALTDFTIKINNRKVLAGIAEVIGEIGKETIICVAIDKLDKIGKDAVKAELLNKGIKEEAVNLLSPFFEISGNFQERLDFLSILLAKSEIGLAGINELKQVLGFIDKIEIRNAKIELDTTLARGLSYYTGCIFEVKVNNVSIGSISGGGRYDDLTGVFGLPDVPGVGFSFGVDRIYDVLDELNLFPETTQIATKVMIATFDLEGEQYGFELLQALRKASISSELYPESVKMKKQMAYADAKKIPFVIIIGSDEISSGICTLKDMITGEQFKLRIEEIIEKLK